MWLALAILGQIASLRLIDAGPLIHYQHYVLPPAALHDPARRWALLAVALQAALVLAGLWWRTLQRAAANFSSPPSASLPAEAGSSTLKRAPQASHIKFAKWRIAGALALSLCLAAAVSRDRRFFAFELVFAALIQLLNAANIVLFAWALPEKALATVKRLRDAVLGGEWKGKTRVDRFAWLAAAWIVFVSSLLAWFVYQRHPHVADEVVYLYSARYFAAGELYMPPPPLPAAFDLDLMDYQPDKWFSAVPVGWPAVLSAGEKLHAAWLVNPILGGLNVLLIYVLLGELYPRRIARIAVLLLCISPWYLFLSMSYMNHIVTLTCALVAFWGVMRARATGRAWWALTAGLAIGITSTIRPLDGAIMALLCAAWALGLGGSRLRFAPLAALAVGVVLAGAAALPYNKVLNGGYASPLTYYTDKTYGHKAAAYGFGPERGLGWAIDPYPGHTPFEAVILGDLNGHSLNTDLFGWSTGSLFLMPLFLFLGLPRRADRLMLAVTAVTILAYAPYWTNGGPDFGARYWFLILIPCLAFSAGGLQWLEARIGARALAAVAALCALTLIVYIPWRSVDKYRDYLRMRPDVRSLASDYHFGRSLVLVRGERFPDYASAAIYNPLDLQADAPIFVWDRSADVRAKILNLYADRPVWVLEGPSITGTGFRVAEGPLRAGTVP
ncbi:MAG TPA: glycosyltransferase family 39 protein [Bryobacteraceae bacterium]